MMWPPSLLRLRIRNGKHRFGLWLPLFIVLQAIFVYLHNSEQLKQVHQHPSRPRLPQVPRQEIVKRGHRMGRDEAMYGPGFDHPEERRSLLSEGLAVGQDV